MTRQSKSYASLYTRNWPIIAESVQDQISQFRLGVAGCGATGGSVVDGALRLGIQYFHLCDTGTYEAANLNRQMVSRAEIGVNKATAYAKRVTSVNSEATVKLWDGGLTAKNIDSFLDGIDFLFDAIDVTNAESMKIKLLLHERAAAKKIATGVALNLAYVQWLRSFNYHLGEAPLSGRLDAARKIDHPLKALLMGFSSVDELPLEVCVEIIRLIENPEANASQLACVCFALSGVVTPYFLHFMKKRPLPSLLNIDLQGLFESPAEKEHRATQTAISHARLRELLSKVS